MTPEQTLDWLAQQHFDQCREDRPVQYWIRKMKSELPVQPPLPVQEQSTAWKDRVKEEICKKCGVTVLASCGIGCPVPTWADHAQRHNIGAKP